MSITPRQLAGLAGNYNVCDQPITSSFTTSTTSPTVAAVTAGKPKNKNKSKRSKKPITQSQNVTLTHSDLGQSIVLPLTPPTSDNEKLGTKSADINNGGSGVLDHGDSLLRETSSVPGETGVEHKERVKVKDFGVKRVVLEEEEEEEDEEQEDTDHGTEELKVEHASLEPSALKATAIDLEGHQTESVSDSETGIVESEPTRRPTTRSKNAALRKGLRRYMVLYRLGQLKRARKLNELFLADEVVRGLMRLDLGGVPSRKAVKGASSRDQAQIKPGVVGRREDEVGDQLMKHLQGMLQVKSQASPAMTPTPAPADEPIDIKPKIEATSPSSSPAPSTPFPVFEKEPPLFLRRPPTPSSNPIRYPRGYIPPTPFISSTSADESEVSVEFVKAKPRIVKVMESMTTKMRERFEGEAWVRKLDDECRVEEESRVEEEEVVRTKVERYLVEGRKGEVRWEEGVGKLFVAKARGQKAVKQEDGVEVEDEEEFGDVYVFLDHSNIHHGMISTLVSRPLPNLTIGTKKILNIPILSLLMLRGRHAAKDGMHLVASSPLEQGLDPAVKMGWRCCVLKRVAVDGAGTSSDSEREAVRAREISARKDRGSLIPADDTTTDSDSPRRAAILPNLSDASITSRRMREQAVDELLHLQILQTLLFAPRPGTLILGTGDAKGGQFNDLGFLGCVKMAVERGWKVELWSWRKGMSRMWREEAKRCGWSRKQFRLYELDDWVEEVVMERESSGRRSRRR